MQFQKLHNSNEEVPNCYLCCFFNVAQQINNSYGSINSQSETCRNSNLDLCVDSGCNASELYIKYDCSQGDVRYFLLQNTMDFLCSLLLNSSSSIFFTNSLLSYYSLTPMLLENYRNISLVIRVFTFFSFTHS